MRPSIEKLEPKIHESKNKRLYSRLSLPDLERVEDGGYKLEGDIFATGDRDAIHNVIDQYMDRVDQALAEARVSSKR